MRAAVLVALALLGRASAQAVPIAAPPPAPPAAPPPPAPPRPPPAGFPPDSPAVVCTTVSMPETWVGGCDPATKTPTQGAYDVHMFLEAARRVGWVEGVDWEWKCVGFLGNATSPGIIDRVADPAGDCSVAVAGITASASRRDLGVVFSYPSLDSALAVIVQGDGSSAADGWQFLNPFTWDLWLAMAVTALLFPVAGFVLELLSVQGRILRHDWFVGLREATWRSWWTMLMYEPFQVTSLAARVAAVAYGVCALLVFNSYIANLTAEATVSRFSSSIRSIDDLRGKAVGTLGVYTARLAKYGITARALPRDSTNLAGSYTDWGAALANGSIKALVGDDPLFRFIRANYLPCTTRVLDFTLEPFDIAFAFKEGAPPAVVDRFSEALLQMQEDGFSAAQFQKDVIAPTDGCPNPTESTSTALTLDQIWGLWVILAAAAGIGAVFLGITTWMERAHLRRLLAEEEAAALAAAAKPPPAAGAAKGAAPAAGKSVDVDAEGEPSFCVSPTVLEHLLPGVEALCVAHEKLKAEHAELKAELRAVRAALRKQHEPGWFMDDDGNRVVDASLTEAPFEDAPEDDA